MLKNKLIKSVCLLDRFNHFNIFFFISQDMKSKVFKIFFYTFNIQISFLQEQSENVTWF